MSRAYLITIADATLTVEPIAVVEGYPQYSYKIEVGDRVLDEGTDLSGGYGPISTRKAMSALLGFLSADAEKHSARHYGPADDEQDDPYMFSAETLWWLDAHDGDVQVAQTELDRSVGIEL